MSRYIQMKQSKALLRISVYWDMLKREPWYFADSFGKDSCVVRDLLMRAKEQYGIVYDGHHNFTTCDPSELVRFGMENHSEVEIHKPKTSMFALIEQKGVPPTRMVRYCCDHLKERGGSGRIVVTGIRSEESASRSKRQIFEHCYTDTTKKYFHPIIDWTERDVWRYIEAFNIPVCSLYDTHGFTRLGCVMCPKASRRNQMHEMEVFPKWARAYLGCFRRALKIPHPTHKIQFQSEYDMLCWYVTGKHLKSVDNETAMRIMNVGERPSTKGGEHNTSSSGERD
jgi:phosphoadenosine phosphosulfate reductase